MPETRFEIIDGEVIYVPPALPPHATRHSKVSAILEAYVAPGFEVASDMLTRTSENSDMAPDASVFPSSRDPITGERQLEHLVFEVVSTERLSSAAKKAGSLAARGVRRIFALDVERGRALEWSRRTDAWEILAPSAVVEDEALALPLPVHDLIVAAKADDAVARALLAKRNPVLVEALTASRTEGKAEGKAQGEAQGLVAAKRDAVLAVLAARKIEVDDRQRTRIRREADVATLDRLLQAAVTCRTAAELFAEGKPTRATRRRRER